MELIRKRGEFTYSITQDESDAVKKFFEDHRLTKKYSERIFDRYSGWFYAYDSHVEKAVLLNTIGAEIDPSLYYDDINAPLYTISSTRPHGFAVNLAVFRIISPMPFIAHVKIPTVAFLQLVKASEIIYDAIHDYSVAQISFKINRVK